MQFGKILKEYADSGQREPPIPAGAPLNTRHFRYSPLADMGYRSAHVRFWPKADIGDCAAHVRFWG